MKLFFCTVTNNAIPSYTCTVTYSTDVLGKAFLSMQSLNEQHITLKCIHTSIIHTDGFSI